MRYDPMNPTGNTEPASEVPTTPKPRRAKKAPAPNAALVSAIDRVPDDAIVYLLAEAGRSEADLLTTRLNFRAFGQRHADEYRDWRVAWRAFADAGLPVTAPTVAPVPVPVPDSKPAPVRTVAEPSPEPAATPVCAPVVPVVSVTAPRPKALVTPSAPAWTPRVLPTPVPEAVELDAMAAAFC